MFRLVLISYPSWHIAARNSLWLDTVGNTRSIVRRSLSFQFAPRRPLAHSVECLPLSFGFSITKRPCSRLRRSLVVRMVLVLSFFRAKSTPYFRVTRSKDLISQFVTSILNPPAPCRTRCIALPRLHRSDLMHPARPSSRLISWRQLSGNGYEKGTLLQVSVPFRVFFLKPSPV